MRDTLRARLEERRRRGSMRIFWKVWWRDVTHYQRVSTRPSGSIRSIERIPKRVGGQQVRVFQMGEATTEDWNVVRRGVPTTKWLVIHKIKLQARTTLDEVINFLL